MPLPWADSPATVPQSAGGKISSDAKPLAAVNLAGGSTSGSGVTTDDAAKRALASGLFDDDSD